MELRIEQISILELYHLSEQTHAPAISLHIKDHTSTPQHTSNSLVNPKMNNNKHPVNNPTPTTSNLWNFVNSLSLFGVVAFGIIKNPIPAASRATIAKNRNNHLHDASAKRPPLWFFSMIQISGCARHRNFGSKSSIKRDGKTYRTTPILFATAPANPKAANAICCSALLVNRWTMR